MNAESNGGRDLGSNGHGTGHWWQQRVSAIALVPLLVWFVVSLASVPVADRPSMLQWIQSGMNALWLGALVLAAAQHSYLGTCVIVEDYVSSLKGRAATVVMLQFTHIVMAGAGVFAVLRVALGA
jgi:succinate dehydrogenase / fumarate reductase membrane anchor subunit